MAEIPCDDVIDLVKRSERDVKCIRDELSMEYSARNITFRKDRSFIGEFEVLKAR